MDSTALSSVWDNFRKKIFDEHIYYHTVVCSLALAIKDKEKELGWQYVAFLLLFEVCFGIDAVISYLGCWLWKLNS